MIKLLEKESRSKIKRLLSVMLPLIGTQIAMVGMYFFDASMSGQAGDVDLAGAAIGGNLWMPVQTGLNGVLMAAMPLVANYLGAGEKHKIETTVRNGLMLAVAFGLFVILCGALFIDLLFSHMGLESGVQYVATWYLAGLGIGVIPFFMNTPLRCLIDTMGYTHLTMRIYWLALPINACLNYIMIFGKLGFPALGGIGAGIASGVTNWILFCCFAWVVSHMQKFEEYNILHMEKPAWHTIKEYLSIGFPMGISIFMETSIFGVVAFFMAKFGTEAIAAHQAALNFSSIVYMIPLSFSMALTIVVGVEYGAKAYKAARDYVHLGLQLSVMIAAIYMLAEYIFVAQIASIYTTSDSVADLIKAFIIYAIWWQFGDMFACPIQGILRGYKDVKSTFYASMIAYWVICLPFGMLFDYYLGHGPFSYWQSLVMGTWTSAIILLFRLQWLHKKIARDAEDKTMAI